MTYKLSSFAPCLRWWICYLGVIIACSISHLLLAQAYYPVQSTTQLVPPYSVYLSDYAQPGNEKLRVILLQRDLTQPAYDLRLVMSVELNGRVILRTSPLYNPPPITVLPGVPTVISGAQLAPYLDSRNIDFVGYSREQYERTRALPEGNYRISFVVYDYRRRDVQVSNESSTFYFLAKGEPPLINFPACGSKVPAHLMQQVVFSWLPRNTASPNSAANTEYELALYEIRPAGRNPNDVVLTSPAVFRVRTDLTQFVYGPTEPTLIEGMQYAWRVQAIDKSGRDAFRNHGFSEVCTFTYGGVNPMLSIGVVDNLQAESETPRRARIWWTADRIDTVRVYYKKTGEGYEWFYTDTDKKELKLFGLEPDTEYETRVQGRVNGEAGPYGNIVTFRTRPEQVAQCGDDVELPPEVGAPLPFAVKGMVLEARGLEMTLLDVTHLTEDGWYKGSGRVSVPYFGGASFTVTFDRIYVNDSRQVVLGRIDFITRGMEEWIEEKLPELPEEAPQPTDQPDGQPDHQPTDHPVIHPEILVETIIAAVAVNDEGDIVVTGEDGTETVYDRPVDSVTGEPEEVVVADAGGNRYVVGSDGVVSKAGSEPQAPMPAITREVREKILKIILSDFRSEISTWLRNNGKGPLDQRILEQILSVAEFFPEEEGLLVALRDNLIPEFEETPSTLLTRIELNAHYKDQFAKASALFEKPEEVDLEEIPDEQRRSLKEGTANALIDAWWERLPYWKKAAEVLEEHLEDTELFESITRSCSEDRCLIQAEFKIADDISYTMDIEITSSMSENEVINVLREYRVDFWDTYSILSESIWEDLEIWWRKQNDDLAQQKGWGVDFVNTIADIVSAPLLVPAIKGWVTGKHYRDGHELAGWEQALAVLDFFAAEEIAKAGVTKVVVSVGRKTLNITQIRQQTRLLLSNAVANGFKLNVLSEKEFVLLSKEGVELAKIIDTKFLLIHKGREIIIDLNKRTTLLGRYIGGTQNFLLAKFQDSGIFNLLNVENWTKPTAPSSIISTREAYRNANEFWELFNKRFIDDAVANGDNILLLNDPSNLENLFYADDLRGFIDIDGRFIPDELIISSPDKIRRLIELKAFPTMFGREVIYLMSLGVDVTSAYKL